MLDAHFDNFHSYHCDMCKTEQVFPSNSELQKHKLTHHATNKVNISISGHQNFYRNKHSLTQHSTLNLATKNNCPKSFTADFDLQSYSYKYATAKPFVCNILNPKPFQANFQMKMYLRKYFISKNFACGLCQKRFSHYNLYKVHCILHFSKWKR